MLQIGRGLNPRSPPSWWVTMAEVSKHVNRNYTRLRSAQIRSEKNTRVLVIEEAYTFSHHGGNRSAPSASKRPSVLDACEERSDLYTDITRHLYLAQQTIALTSHQHLRTAWLCAAH